MQAYMNTGDPISRSEFPCILATYIQKSTKIS